VENYALTFDGGPEWLLRASALVLERGEAPAAGAGGVDEGQGLLEFGQTLPVLEVPTDAQAAERARALLSRIDPALPEELKILAEAEPSVADRVFRYLLEVGTQGPQARFDYANPAVRAVREAHRRVTKEIHRMTGLLRFERAPGGLLVARMKPDNDILGELAPHFLERLGLDDFLILDEGRGKAFLKFGGESGFLGADKAFSKVGARLEGADSEAAELWRIYYAAIEVEGRRNLALRNRFIPGRYRKYLPELGEGAPSRSSQ
jgi:probable DNA metabolism protein